MKVSKILFKNKKVKQKVLKIFEVSYVALGQFYGPMRGGPSLPEQIFFCLKSWSPHLSCRRLVVSAFGASQRCKQLWPEKMKKKFVQNHEVYKYDDVFERFEKIIMFPFIIVYTYLQTRIPPFTDVTVSTVSHFCLKID